MAMNSIFGPPIGSIGESDLDDAYPTDDELRDTVDRLGDRLDEFLDRDALKRETDNDLRAAREARLDREARDRFKAPILDAFDRLGRAGS